MTETAIFDPKGLIREAFAIEGIGAPECRSIFLDWALGVPADGDVRAELARLVRHYESRVAPDHPMLATMRAGLQDAPRPHRRGGRGGRLDDPQR